MSQPMYSTRAIDDSRQVRELVNITQSRSIAVPEPSFSTCKWNGRFKGSIIKKFILVIVINLKLYIYKKVRITIFEFKFRIYNQ